MVRELQNANQTKILLYELCAPPSFNIELNDKLVCYFSLCFSVHGKKSNCLQSAKVPLISERECRRMYADSTRDIDKG